MFNPCNLLLIDGNHLCHRVYWTHTSLSYGGKPTGVLYGFLKSLISFKKQYPDYVFVVCWDGGYERRKQESIDAVNRGIILSSYKENRRQGEISEDLESMFSQKDELQNILYNTKIIQSYVKGFEGDDLIYSYVMKNVGGNTIVVTGDRDFYQLLKDGVELYDPIKKETWTRSSFINKYGFDPELWVDVGAISGDKSDNIIGVDGWGEKTALKYVKEHGNADAVLSAVRDKSKRGKKEEALLDSEDIIRVAKSLKQMDIVPGLPKLKFSGEYSTSKLKKIIINYGLLTLLKDVWRLVK